MKASLPPQGETIGRTCLPSRFAVGCLLVGGPTMRPRESSPLFGLLFVGGGAYFIVYSVLIK
jgi:hypothetical protein